MSMINLNRPHYPAHSEASGGFPFIIKNNTLYNSTEIESSKQYIACGKTDQ